MEKKYQIFISSTYKDLIEARSKVRDAILSMMHFPVGMEMFNAADEEQWEIIQETIDSSDYYVLILGQRYGSVIESGSDAGISYTEKEFRYAREKKIPVLVFIIDDDVAIKPEFIEKDPESIKKLADFKTEAKKGRTVQWWTNIDELAREVSESLHQQMDRKKRPGWIRGDAFDIEASHAEILSLNKKIRELEQENAELKSQIVKRVPELVAAVVLDQQDDEEVDGKGLKTHGKLLKKGKTVIFDRYIYDIYVDPVRSKIRLPQRLLRFFADIAPQMDASLIMLCDPDIIYARKQELSKDEIIRQIGMYRKLAESRKTFFVFDSSLDVMENVREARRTVGI